MLHLTQTIEEFAARRRQAQSDLEDHLRSYVEQALDTGADTHGWDELLDVASALYNDMYHDESGNTGTGLPASVRNQWKTTLQKTKMPRDEATRDRIATWLATAILTQSAIQAAQDDPEELFLEWVDMDDEKVRLTHQKADGQQRPVGEKFDVGDYDMVGPGDPTVPIELWINCRCTLRPVLAKEAFAMEFRDVPTDERNRRADDGSAMPDGSYPIANCSDLRNAIQAIGRAKDPEKTKAHIRKRKSSLGCPDVELPWANEGESMANEETEPMGDSAVPWHGVLAPEGVKSGDGRKFKAGALRTRPLPLPFTWQKISDDGHKGNVTVAKIERITRVEGEMRATGSFLTIPEADEVIGLIAEFGKFGVSIDADDASFELDDDDMVEFTDARIASACIVPIPAFSEAWASLGEAPEGFMDGEEVTADGPAAQPALVASANVFTDIFKDLPFPPKEEEDECKERDDEGNCIDPKPDEPTKKAPPFKDLAPGKTEDGPGWLTHPVDTDRLRDYWVRGPGAAKIGWGVAGDFNRCRLNVAEYVKPQYLNGYCANRHYDALGFWPGRPVAGETEKFAGEKLGVKGESEGVSLVAAGGYCAPSEWFENPELDHPTALTVTEEGRVFGHIAQWDTCHIAFKDVCTVAPHSLTDYAYFCSGGVLLDNGETARVGTISVGGGHAQDGLGVKQALAHYDSTSTAVADVTLYEDEFGIACAGWIRPGVSDEMVTALRASKLSGDWRDVAGNLELVAVLAVNVPGFGVPRTRVAASGNRQVSLVAAGIVDRDERVQDFRDFDVEAVAAAVVAHLAKQQRNREEMARLRETFQPNTKIMAELAARLNGDD